MTKYIGTLSRLISKKTVEVISYYIFVSLIICTHYIQGALFTQMEVAKFLLDIISGLEALHNLNIIHRDLKVPHFLSVVVNAYHRIE